MEINEVIRQKWKKSSVCYTIFKESPLTVPVNFTSNSTNFWFHNEIINVLIFYLITCIINTKVPIGTITFTRRCLSDTEVPDFSQSKKTFRKVLFREEGTIEDCSGTLQVENFI